jgi:hypothetical protein
MAVLGRALFPAIEADPAILRPVLQMPSAMS